MENKKLIELDITRAIAIVAVIILHLTTVIVTSPEKVMNLPQFLFIDQIGRFSVPAFIFISGMGLGFSLRNKPKKFSEFFKARMSKILPLYIIFSFIYFFLPVPQSNHYVLGFISDLFMGKANFHLYFIPIIVQLYIIFPYIYRYSKNLNFILIILAINLLLLVFVDYSIQIHGIIKHLLDYNSCIFWSFYFIFGIYCSYNIFKIKSFLEKHKNCLLILFLIAGTIIFFDSITSFKSSGQVNIKTICFLRPAVLFYTLSFLMFVFSFNWINTALNSIFNYLSRASYFIYLSHVAFLQIFNKLYNHFFGMYNLFYLVCGFIFTLIGTIAAYEILLKIKYVNKYL